MGRSGTKGSEGLRRFADLILPPGGLLIEEEAPGQDLTWGPRYPRNPKTLFIYIYVCVCVCVCVCVFILFFWDIILGFHQFLKELCDATPHQYARLSHML